MNALEDYLLEPDLEGIEKLIGNESLNLSGKDKETLQAAIDTLKGNYEKILTSPSIRPLVLDLNFESADVFEVLSKRAESFLEMKEDNELAMLENQMLVLILGIVYLSLFVQINWTGPSLPPAFKEVPQQIHKKLVAELGRDGEIAYAKVKFPHLLLAARSILVDQFPNLDRLKSACWWSSRCLFIHQQVLAQKVPSIKQTLQQRFQIISRTYAEAPENHNFESESSSARELAAKASLELGLVHHYYRSVQKAKESFELAQKWSGLKSNLTGVLGRRTRFQTFDNAQLVLDASSSKRDNSAITNGSSASTPHVVPNEDPTLLSTPALLNPVDDSNLRVIDQAILLALCLNVKNQNPNHGLTTEEMAPYIRRVQEHPNNWLVHTLGLLIKSRLESESTKTVERAALQLQVLDEQFEDETAPADVRMRYFYKLPFPSKWELKQEVGERMLSIGAAASALAIFEELEIWDKIIECYKIMDRLNKAEEVVRQRLEVSPTPELWCVLGDLKNDPQFYQNGWELSNHHHARAMRSLGRYYLGRKEYAKTVECYTTALAINPLFPASWFSLGCAAMQVEKFEEALNAFSRVVSLEPEEGEAWANMASIYMSQNKMSEAYVSLQEGLKYRRDSWKMWQNFLACCLETGEFQQALYTMHQLLDLRDKEVDVKVLRILTKIVLQDIPDRYGETGSKLQKPVAELLGRVTSKIATNPEIWLIYATFHGGLGNKDKELDCLLKAARYTETAGWERDTSLFEKVANVNILLAKAYLETNDPKHLDIYSAKLKLKSLVKKTEDTFRQTPAHTQLTQLLEQAEEKEAATANKTLNK